MVFINKGRKVYAYEFPDSVSTAELFMIRSSETMKNKNQSKL